MMAVSIAIMPGFLRRFTQDEELIAAGITYSTIVFLFLVVNMVSLAFEKIFQAVGRMKVSMVALITHTVLDIIRQIRIYIIVIFYSIWRSAYLLLRQNGLSGCQTMV